MTITSVNQNCCHPKTKKPLLIILLGAPGSGKGTLAPMIGDHLEIPPISTGDLFRTNIQEKTSIGLKAKKFIDEGNLVPDEIVLEMLFERLLLPDCAKGAILDGVPRTIFQAEILDKRLEKSHRFLTFVLETDEDLLVERICARLTCQACKIPHHKKNLTTNTCPSCGGDLTQRPDDTEETFKKRLQVYQNQTEPLTDYYSQKEDTLYKVNGGQLKDNVFKEMLIYLNKLTQLV